MPAHWAHHYLYVSILGSFDAEMFIHGPYTLKCVWDHSSSDIYLFSEIYKGSHLRQGRCKWKSFFIVISC